MKLTTPCGEQAVAGLNEALLAKAAGQKLLRDGHRAVPHALSGRMRGRLRRALGELAVTIGRTATIVAQVRTRLAGQMPDGATRLVSLHDPDVRPMTAAGSSRAPVSSGSTRWPASASRPA
jgi:IS5 family transposase